MRIDLAKDAIAFIVPTYNRAPFLGDCLDSIRLQSGPRDEIVVVDDGSSDDTPAVLSAYCARHRAAIRVVRLANGGKSRALNHALRMTSAPLVWIIDDDDVLLPRARWTLTNLISAEPRRDFSYGRHDRITCDAGNPPLQAPRLGTGYWSSVDADDLLIATMEDMFAHQPGMLVRRSLYDRVGPFDESLPRSIDYEMAIRLAWHGAAVGTDELVFLQRQHEGPRGPAAHRIEGSKRNASWIARDGDIFVALRDRLPLELYLPTRQIADGGDMRRALIQRGTIMARKGLWAQAVEDFRDALTHSANQLTKVERAIARRAFGSKYGADQFFGSSEVPEALASLAKASSAGGKLARAIVRGFYWHLRAPGRSLAKIRTAAQLTRAAWG